MRLGPEHHELILNYAEKHSEIITNNWTGLSGHNNSKQLWEILTNELNALGFGILSTAEYKRRLTDWKSKTKGKAVKIKNIVIGTGGGPPGEAKLTEQENRLLSLMGNKSYEGDSVQEMGLSSCISRQSFINQSQLLSTQKTSKKFIKRPQSHLANPTLPKKTKCNEEIIICMEDNWEENKLPSDNIANNIQVDSAEVIEEHCYANIETPTASTQEKNSSAQGSSRSTQRRRRVQDLGLEIRDMNSETLTVLKDINTNLSNIDNNLTKMNDSLIALTRAILNNHLTTK